MSTENEVKDLNAMSPEQQRIAIAEACGWKLVDMPDHPNGHKSLWKTPKGEQLQTGADYALPDFLNSLDAMHEAEKVLTNKQRQDYVDALASTYATDAHSVWFHLAHATAAQRAEAFLKTLGLWKDS